MTRLAGWLVVALVAAGVVFVAATAGQLPPTVATHFGAGGAANGWMSRGGYTVFALALTVVLPLVLYAGFGWLPHRFERFVNLPNRDYWLAATRREGTIAWLRAAGTALAILAALLSIGVHAMILDANAKRPPRLDEPVFLAGLAVFVVGVVGVTIAVQRKFRRVPARR